MTDQQPGKSKFKSVLFSIPIIIVFVLTYLLVAYIGYGEAKRTYPSFQTEKMATLGEIIKNSFENHLNNGFPLEQFSGFNSLGKQILISDSDLESIRITNISNKTIFYTLQNNLNQDNYFESLRNRKYQENTDIVPDTKKGAYTVLVSESSYKVKVQLKSKFGDVGHIVLEADKEKLLQPLYDKYQYVFYTLIILIVIVTIVIMFFELTFKEKKIRQTLVKALYATSFMILSVMIGITVFRIYEQGAEAKTEALSNSMAQRLKAITDLGINISDISGIKKTFLDYKNNNKDIRYIALTQDNISLYHTDEEKVGNKYLKDEDTYEYTSKIENFNLHTSFLKVAIAIPKEIVSSAVLSNARNFLVLFAACGLIAIIFLNAGTGLLSIAENSPFDFKTFKKFYTAGLLVNNFDDEKNPDEDDLNYEIGLNLIKPAYFLVVFVNAMSVSFLPQLVVEFADKAPTIGGLELASTTLPFTIFYLLFALVLIPAGQFAEHGSLKKLMLFGFISEVIGLSLVAFSNNYWLLTAGRAFSGIGQGLFLIGLQSYVLVVVPKDKKTQGASVKVFGRNAGLIAGTAIGALLYSYLDYKFVFIISSVLTLIGISYLWGLVPDAKSVYNHAIDHAKGTMSNVKHFFSNIFMVFKDREFLKTIMFVGLIGKMSITGVIMFAGPLILSKQNFAYEDIGQALMLYYISSIIMNHFASKLVDKLGNTKLVLFLSTLIGGIGMVFFGFIGVTQLTTSSIIPGVENLTIIGVKFNQILTSTGIEGIEGYVIIFCLMLTGLSNGLLTAPIVSHITRTDIAEEKGDKSIIAIYTFIERGGHVVGPMVISYLLLLTIGSNVAISLFGILTALLGLLFVIFSKK